MEAQRPARGDRSHRHQIPPEQRRRWLIGTVIGIVVAVVAITGGPWVYARVTAQPPEEPLELSTPSTTAPADPDAPIDPDGTWTVAEGSEAGYRIGEVLNGDQVEVVGRTSTVTGTVSIAAGSLTAVTVTVDAATLTTDSTARDVYVRRALDTSTYPEASFVLTEPVDVAPVGTQPSPVSVAVTGTLTIGAADLPVTAELQVQRTVAGLEVVGSVPVVLADLGLTAPDLGFVTVEPQGTVEFRLLLTR